MQVAADQFAASLEKGLKPVYLFGGSEPLLMQECHDALRKAAAAQGFLERELVEIDRGFDWEEWDPFGGSASLFSSKKIIDVRMPTGKPGQKGGKALSALVDTLGADDLFMLSCESWDKSSRTSKWARTLADAGVQVDIWPIGPNELPGWISKRMQKAGLEPEREAILVLAERLEGNLLAANQEIEKLVLLKGQGTVTAEDVLESVADSSRFDSWLLAERILSGDLADGLRVATGLQRTGVAIQLVTGALVRELQTFEGFRVAMKKGESESLAFRKLNVWRNRQVAMKKALQRVDGVRLSEAFARLALIDQQSKGRADGDAWHELDRLVCNLCA